jgi:hypothetical protein
MEFRQFGRTNLNVSAIGFGCWEIGGTYGRIDESEFQRAVARAIDSGTNSRCLGDFRTSRRLPHARPRIKRSNGAVFGRGIAVGVGPRTRSALPSRWPRPLPSSELLGPKHSRSGRKSGASVGNKSPMRVGTVNLSSRVRRMQATGSFNGALGIRIVRGTSRGKPPRRRRSNRFSNSWSSRRTSGIGAISCASACSRSATPTWRGSRGPWAHRWCDSSQWSLDSASGSADAYSNVACSGG